MKIQGYNQNNISFKNSSVKALVAKEEVGHFVEDNIRNLPKLEKGVKGKAPLYLVWLGKSLKKLAPFTEKNVVEKKRAADQLIKSGVKTKKDPVEAVENLVNIGNIAKEAVSMVVYPIQVLTNPDLPKDKRRFIGLYDFFVICFSLGGTVLYAWKGTKYMNKLCEKLMSKYTKDITKYPKALRAIQGGAFVVGIALQTILFKRVLAPAIAPVLAGKCRKKLEENDAKKAANKSEETANLIPPQYDAALSANKKQANALNANNKNTNSEKLPDKKAILK